MENEERKAFAAFLPETVDPTLLSSTPNGVRTKALSVRRYLLGLSAFCVATRESKADIGALCWLLFHPQTSFAKDLNGRVIRL